MLRVPSKFDSPCVKSINGTCDVIDCPFVHERIEQQFVKLNEEELNALLVKQESLYKAKKKKQLLNKMQKEKKRQRKQTEDAGMDVEKPKVNEKKQKAKPEAKKPVQEDSKEDDEEQNSQEQAESMEENGMETEQPKHERDPDEQLGFHDEEGDDDHLEETALEPNAKKEPEFFYFKNKATAGQKILHLAVKDKRTVCFSFHAFVSLFA